MTRQRQCKKNKKFRNKKFFNKLMITLSTKSDVFVYNLTQRH